MLAQQVENWVLFTRWPFLHASWHLGHSEFSICAKKRKRKKKPRTLNAKLHVQLSQTSPLDFLDNFNTNYEKEKSVKENIYDMQKNS